MGYIKNIREALKDPKKKSLTQLGLWLIFFIFVSIILRSADSNDTPIIVEPKTPMEVYESMNGYTYSITYTSLDKTEFITGTYYNNESIFNFNNQKYYYEDSLYIIDNDSYYLSNIEYNVSKIFNKNLYNIIKELTEESKTTYKDGTIATNYIIDSNKIYNYFYEMESTYTNLVSVSIIEKEDIITNIVLDLTNLGLNLNKIEIEYNNVNNIQSLEFNKENYTYRESL